MDQSSSNRLPLITIIAIPSTSCCHPTVGITEFEFKFTLTFPNETGGLPIYKTLTEPNLEYPSEV